MEVEALVRPRMPVLMTASDLDAYTEMEEEEDAEDMAEEFHDVAPKTVNFLKEPVTPALEPREYEKPSLPTNKRTYVEETAGQPRILTVGSEKQPTQIKKARFEESVSRSSEASSTVVTRESTPVSHPAQVQASSAPKATSTTLETVPQSAVSATLADNESDDELPTLNVDPDTEDEDDEDEDVTMDG